MPEPKSIVLQVRIPTRHARLFRKIVKREGLTVSGALYRHVLEVVKKDLFTPGLVAEWRTAQLVDLPKTRKRSAR